MKCENCKRAEQEARLYRFRAEHAEFTLKLIFVASITVSAVAIIISIFP